MPNKTSPPQIAIIGAGPAGLTLARILHINGVSATVFDLDASRHNRDQGGTLDLSIQDGQAALAAASLSAEFRALARPEGQAKKMVQSDGRVLWDDNESETGAEYASVFENPEIDRNELRNMLIDSLPTEIIRWGSKVASIIPSINDSSKYHLHFADGSSEGPFDLIVGADGAWSKVRPLLTTTKPYYSGVSMAEVWALDAGTSAPAVAKYVGEGSCFMFDEGRAVIAQRAGHGNIRVYAGVRQPESWLEDCGIDWKDSEAAKTQLVERYFGDCGEELKKVVLGCKDKLVARKLYMLPVGAHWENRPGLTMIGDAAHLMTPFAGVGVNCAMRDSLELANRIVEAAGAGNLYEAVKAFEQEMFPRAKAYQAKTAHGLHHHFSKNGTVEMADRIKKGNFNKMAAWEKSQVVVKSE